MISVNALNTAAKEINRIMYDLGMTPGEAVLCLAAVIAHALADETDERTTAMIAELNFLIVKGREHFRDDSPSSDAPEKE
jgi:hypothetical protein